MQPRNDGDQNEQAQNNAQNVSIMDFFRIPDSIKALPHYDGSKRQLHAWLTTAEDTLNYFKGKVDPSIYKQNWTAINMFIEEDGLAAFTSGLKGTYFGHVQAARPKDVEDAYAFLCKFKSQELVAHTTSEKPNKAFTKQERIPKNDNKSYRKPEFRPNLPQEDRSKPHNNQATPMDVDPSLRSRLTLNKKLINNTELESSDHDLSENEEISEEETLEGNTNFCVSIAANDKV